MPDTYFDFPASRALDPLRQKCERLSADHGSPAIASRLVARSSGRSRGVLLLVAAANRYGYRRDELYFRVAARHPAWGYDDQPALTPLLGRLSEWAFGADPRGLRMPSALAIALVVVLVALIARELGAGRAGQAVAALATAASGAAMAVGHILDDDLRRTALGDAGVHRGPDPRRRG